MEFENLFKPGKMGSLELKNRIIFPAICSSYAGEHGQVTDTIINWYERRAKGGASLLVVEVCYVATAIDRRRQLWCQLRADDDNYIAGLGRLAEAVHDFDAKIAIQLSPGPGAQATAGPYALGSIENIPLVSPSGIPALGSTKKPRVLSEDEIAKIVELCGESARRVKQAGFDAIEFHGHGGYLIAQFLSPYFNKRTDKYGGSLDNRCRFFLEIVESMRKAVGPDFALIAKYSIHEYIDGGREIEESQIIARKLEEAGVDCISISSGVYYSGIPAVPPHYFPPGVLIPLSEAMKEAVKIPVIAVGRLDDPRLAEQVLKDGKADFIGVGRGLIADPDWPVKVARGQLDEIRKCVACNFCREELFVSKAMRCTVNPIIGREGKYDVIKPAEVKKKVVIVGAGPGGMEAAQVAALRGHDVVLFEKANELGGGQLKIASVPPHKKILLNIVDYHAAIFKKLPNLSVRLGTEATAEEIFKENPDAVIVATGAAPLIPDIPGVDKSIVVTAFDVLAEKVEVGETVVILGGRTVGCETANWLAKKGKKVTIIARSDSVGAGIERWSWLALKDELAKGEVQMMPETNVKAITDEGVTVTDKTGRESFLKADTVILARGAISVNSLAKELKGRVKELYIIGDAKEPRRILEATGEGYVTAYNL